MKTKDIRVQRTLLYSIIDGIGYSVMVGAGETYFIPYAIYLGGSNLLLGLFVALPILVGSTAQILSERLLVLLGTRKRVLGTFVALQALTFPPMILLHQMDHPWRTEVFLVIVCVYWSCGLVAGPCWSSLMGDLVPEEERGEYFGRRGRHIQIWTLFGLVLAGGVLYWAKAEGAEAYGFTIILAVSALARTVSFLFLLLHHEPPMESPPTGRTIEAVVETLRHPAQRLLILYLTWMNFAVYLSAPFFAAYMLRTPERQGLDWSYGTYMLVNGIAYVSKFLFMPLWGKSSDRFGSRKCLILAAWLICALPICWIFPPDNAALHFAVIAATQVWSGLAWAGHELCSFNFLLDSAQALERPRLVASMNLINGFMVFVGSTMGAIIVSLAPGGFNAFHVVFLISTLGRFAVCARFGGRLKEVRVVEKTSYRSLFIRVVSVRVQMGAALRFFVVPLKRMAHQEPIDEPAAADR